jgi:hypothetical protein
LRRLLLVAWPEKLNIATHSLGNVVPPPMHINTFSEQRRVQSILIPSVIVCLIQHHTLNTHTEGTITHIMLFGELLLLLAVDHHMASPAGCFENFMVQQQDVQRWLLRFLFCKLARLHLIYARRFFSVGDDFRMLISISVYGRHS